MLKVGKTKKECCQTLGIAYNTTRLIKLVEEFKEKEIRLAELKKAARAKVLTNDDKKEISSSYMSGESISHIAVRLYLTSPRIKKVLLENNIPIRSRAKNKAATTDHVVQNLDVKFEKGDKIFYNKKSCFGIVDRVYDEDYIESLQDIKRERYIQLVTAPENIDSKEGIHYEVYYELENGEEWKRIALQRHIALVEEYIAETGMEYYSVWLDSKKYYYVPRNDLFQVVLT